ncbi:MAG: LysM peptidoglycan-binding domain-containing protein [Verrucomicrobia bacterium]|nr:LysM peptidoglycan-binding domain-containing protein [Verrucomicrobiota bacterium]
MKAHVFISVLAFHVVVIAGLYLLSACSSSRGPKSDQTSSSSSTGGSIYDEYAQPNRPSEDGNLVVTEVAQPQSNSRFLDPAFNSGSSRTSGNTTNSGGGRFSPTRPGENLYNSPNRPVLNEFREDEVLQPLTTTQVASPSVEYQVKKGDSLWKISREFGISLDELLTANGLTKDEPIQVGQKLVISSVDSGPPAIEASTAGFAQSEVYVVVSGDTLSRIAKDFNSTVNDIKVANGLRSDIIQLGQRLTIPVNSISAEGLSAPPPVQTALRVAPIQPATSISIQGDIVHKVEPGETPGGIAKKYGITTTQLMNDNRIQDARKMFVGQELQIRLGVAQPATPPQDSQPTLQPLPTPVKFDNSIFDDLDDIPEVEVVPRS